MTANSFAELLADALNARGMTPGDVARSLKAAGFKIDRGTIRRWLISEHAPGHDSLEMVRRLPRIIGLSPADEAAFLRTADKLLGFDADRFVPYIREPVAIPQRIHFGADELPPFAGRAAELAELRRLILNKQPVLITGLGGVGKTRLAQEALRACVGHFTHGCEYLAVTVSQTSAQIIRHAGRLLGVELDETVATGGQVRSLLDQLRARLMGIELLFLLDNVFSANQVRDLVRGLPGITWVITARNASLKRIGVVSFHLGLPDATDAVAMLRSHVRYAPVADRHDTRAAVVIVERLGRLPLAISLASGQLSGQRLASLSDLETWLSTGGLNKRGAPTFHLQLFFEQMVDSLPATAQEAFELCGVFPTPDIHVAAFRGVSEAAGLSCSLADWETLADFSLVEVTAPGRIRMHALLHAYARRRLQSTNCYSAVQEGFVAHHLSLAESVSLGVSQTERDYRSLLPDEHNLLSAAEALYSAADWTRLKRLWPALSGYLWTMGERRAYEWFDRLCLEAARAIADNGWAADLLSELGYVKKDEGQWAVADALFQESQAFFDAAPGQNVAQARLRRYRAEVALGLGDIGQALALLADAERVLSAAPEKAPPLAYMLLHSARMTVFLRRGELAAAEAAGRAAEELYSQMKLSFAGQRFGEFRIELGDVLIRLDRPDAAEHQWQEVLSMREGLPLLPEHADVQLRLAWLRAAEAQFEEAQRLFRHAWHTFDRHGRLERCQQIEELLALINLGSSLPLFVELFSP